MSSSRKTMVFEISDVIQLSSPVAMTREQATVIAERVVKHLEAKAESVENIFNADKEPDDQAMAIVFDWVGN